MLNMVVTPFPDQWYGAEGFVEQEMRHRKLGTASRRSIGGTREDIFHDPLQGNTSIERTPTIR